MPGSSMRLLPLAVNGGRYDELKTARSASPDELMRGGSVEAEGLFGLLIFASLAKEVGLADISNHVGTSYGLPTG